MPITKEEIARRRINLKKERQALELNWVKWALDLSNNNRAVAAELLCLNRPTLVEMMRRLGILFSTPHGRWKRLKSEVQETGL